MSGESLKAKEQIVREKRTLQAISNNLMGTNGKLFALARFLGEPIIKQSLDEDEGLDFYGWNDNPELPTMDENVSSFVEGYFFDGLNRGYHFDVKYIIEEVKINVHFKGRLVYEEAAGDLTAYVPDPEWEKIVNHLFPMAKSKGDQLVKQTANSSKKDTIIKAFFDHLKNRWGF